MEEILRHTNLAQHQIDDIKIIINLKDYKISQEKRLLIPFIAKNNRVFQQNKMGLLNRNGYMVCEPLYDIILDDCFSDEDIIRVGKLFPYGYSNSNGNVSSYVRYKYKAMTTNGDFITDMDFDSIMVSTDKKYITVQDRKKGYAVFDRKGNEIISFGKYSWIDGFDLNLARVNNLVSPDSIERKWGIINITGEEVLPLEYSEIWNFYGKNRDTTRVIKNHIVSEVNLMNMKNVNIFRDKN